MTYWEYMRKIFQKVVYHNICKADRIQNEDIGENDLRKQFERIFTNGIGISPKKFLKVLRFQNAIYQKQLTPGLGLTRLAVDSGY